MVEWSITTVLKTVVLRGTGGSNPSLSAKTKGNELETNELPFNFAKIMDAEWTKKISRYNQHSAKEL